MYGDVYVCMCVSFLRCRVVGGHLGVALVSVLESTRIFVTLKLNIIEGEKMVVILGNCLSMRS